MITFNLGSIDWVAISSFLTLIMIFVTVLSLMHNRSQLKEIKRQWLEETRARLSFSIISKDGLYLLKISNVGKNTAYNIRIIFSREFIECLFSDHIRKTFTDLQEKAFIIEAGVTKYFYISPIYGDSICIIEDKEYYDATTINEWLNLNIKTKIDITGTYCDNYTINESFSIDEFILPSIVINDELTNAVQWIKKGSIVQNSQYMPIQKSLHKIVGFLEKSSFEK